MYPGPDLHTGNQNLLILTENEFSRKLQLPHVKNITQQTIDNWNSKLSSETDPSIAQWVKSITQADIDNWNNIEDIEVQITEDTTFAQIGDTQKDFNRNVSDYKINADLKNNEQDDRIEKILNNKQDRLQVS